MKINPYSNSYTSSSAKRGDSRSVDQRADQTADRVKRGDQGVTHGQSVVKKPSSKAAKADSFRIDPHAGQHPSDQRLHARKRNAALEYRAQNTPSASSPVEYYSANSSASSFYISESNPSAASGDEALKGDFKRVNNQLTARALETYRSHQEMDDEQALRQAHQLVLGVDTYA